MYETREKYLKKIKNKFNLVLAASKRARELSLDNIKPLIENTDDKPTIVALKEIEKVCKEATNNIEKKG